MRKISKTVLNLPFEAVDKSTGKNGGEIKTENVKLVGKKIGLRHWNALQV